MGVSVAAEQSMPILAILMVVGALASLVQTGPVLATEALGFEVRNARIAPADMAAAVKDALAERRVNTGQLCSRFCDAMERRGAQVWPPEYRPITNGWDVVPANTTT